MDTLNLTITEAPTDLSDRVHKAIDELLHLKVDDLHFSNTQVQEDLWYCRMVINILIVGEYCNHLPSSILKAYDINWRRIIQPRNTFAHTTPEAIRSTVLTYINDNSDLEVLYSNINDITDKNVVLPDENSASSGIPKTILKVIHNCFKNNLKKPDSNLPLFDDKLIAQITDLSAKTIRRIRKEYDSQNISKFQNVKVVGFGK